MSRNYINIFLEDTDELAFAETQAGKYNLTVGTGTVLFFTETATLDKFMSNINMLYEDHNARKEARRARHENGSSKQTIPGERNTHTKLKA